MKRIAGLLPLALLAAAAALGQADGDAPADRAARIAPFIGEETFAVARIEPASLDVDAVLSVAADVTRMRAEQLAMTAMPLRSWLQEMARAGGREVYFVFTTATWGGLHRLTPEPFAVVPLEAGTDSAAIERLLGPGGLFGFTATDEVNGAVVAGGERVIEHVRKLQPEERPGLNDAFAAADGAPLELFVFPSRAQQRVFEEVFYKLPDEIGGGPGTIVTEGSLWTALAIDPGPERSLRLVIQSRDAEAARAIHEKVARIYEVTAASSEAGQVVPNAARLVPLITPVVEGDRLVLALDDEAVGALSQGIVGPAVVAARGAATRTQCVANMRQIAIAMILYQDRHKTLPAAASYDAAGKPLLSWRVHVLPFIDQQELYEEFHLDEPWESPHNRKLIERMPDVYRCPAQWTEPGKTCYLVPAGEHTAFPPGAKGFEIKEIADGASKTILVVDADDERAVIWTKPEDLRYDSEKPLKGLVGHHTGGFNAVFVDAHNAFISEAVDPDVLRALFTRDGGEVIPAGF